MRRQRHIDNLRRDSGLGDYKSEEPFLLKRPNTIQAFVETSEELRGSLRLLLVAVTRALNLRFHNWLEGLSRPLFSRTTLVRLLSQCATAPSLPPNQATVGQEIHHPLESPHAARGLSDDCVALQSAMDCGERHDGEYDLSGHVPQIPDRTGARWIEAGGDKSILMLTPFILIRPA